MSLIKDFWTYCQSYEIPRDYALWSALSMIAATTERRVFIKQGDIIHHGNLFISLIGAQGGRKSVTKDFARNIYTEVFPDAVVGASMTSREDIIRFMSQGDTTRTYIDQDGAQIEYKPLVLFINELKNFLSFAPANMIEFLTDIYDRPFFDASTIKRGLEVIHNPCLNILACETPEWILDKLKAKILSGGFSRRMNFVYFIERPALKDNPCIPRPFITDEAREALDRVKKHLALIRTIAGEFTWDAEGGDFFDEWYRKNKAECLKEEDPLIQGYKRTKDVQLLKVAMCIGLDEWPPSLKMTKPLIMTSLEVINSVEVNMSKLSVGAGRNELAVPTQKVLDILDSNGGEMHDKKLMMLLGRDLSPTEQMSVMDWLRRTDQVILRAEKKNGVSRNLVFLPWRLAEVEGR